MQTPQFKTHSDAVGDLQRIREHDLAEYGVIVAFLQELRSNKNWLLHLDEHGYGQDESERISVKQWGSVQRIDHTPLYRLRSWDMEKVGLQYRLIYYCYRNTYHLMAVVKRSDIDYDNPAHPIRSRVLDRIKREFF